MIPEHPLHPPVDAPRDLVLTAHLLELLASFDQVGIAVLPLKGPILAETLYADPSLRPFEDLDVLVRRRDARAAMALLREQGYQLTSALEWLPEETLMRLYPELSFQDRRGTIVDLHWDIAPGDFPFGFDTEILWSSVTVAKIAGRNVPALTHDCLLLYLCVHGLKHLWSRVAWVRDVAKLAEKGLDRPQARALAERAGCLRPVLLGLRLSLDLENAPVPADAPERAHADPVIG